MDIKMFAVSIAALCHDIGKFVQGELKLSKEYIINNESLYQPVYKGRYTHIHALYTAGFIDLNRNLFPHDLFSSELGEDNFLNLSGMHHKPETPLQYIISVADRMSSGFDRDTFDAGDEINIRDFKSTRLVPLLEQLSPHKKREFSSMDEFSYYYPLRPMSASTIFPENRDVYIQESEGYKDLYQGFIKGLSALAHRRDSLILWMQHFLSLFRKYTFFVPAARVGKVIPDVSLYHHSKTTASLATALYKFHSHTNTLEKKYIQNESEEKFLIIAGDFYGIQRFIFQRAGEEAHHRSKLLRGRSFAVSLLCELSGFEICSEIGLTPYSVLLNSAGKFYILAPNTKGTEDAVKRIEEKINKWLIEHTFGETSLGISVTKATPSHFSAEKFRELWDRVQKNLLEKKFNRFSPTKYTGVFNSYLDKFNNELKHPICPLCGVRPSSPITENDKLVYKDKEGSCCTLCRDHIMLGTNLVKDYKIAILKDCANEKLRDKDRYLIEKIFGNYQVLFTQGNLKELANSGELVKLWKVDLDENGNIEEDVTFLPLNGYVPVYEKEDLYDDRLLINKKSQPTIEQAIDEIEIGIPKTFLHISLTSLERNQDGYYGVDALGVLKADVDDLGLLFGCGLPERRFTISRLYGLSTQFNNFFSMYIPHLIKNNSKFKNIYTVFAGGDDLFLIGPWNSIIDFSVILKEKFSEYVCRNNEIHLCAGISVIKANTPVDTISIDVEERLEKAKKHDGKNSVCLFDRVLKWDNFLTILKYKNKFSTLIQENILSKSMLYKLNELINMAEIEHILLDKNIAFNYSNINILKWRSMLNYYVARNINKEYKNKLNELIFEYTDLIYRHRGDLIIPLWTILYKFRKYASI